MRYRKKPIEVEAFKYYGRQKIDPTTLEAYLFNESPRWLSEAWDNGIIFDDDEKNLYIKTLEGNMKVNIGDYVICGIQGEIYPCKPDIFEQTYEAVEGGEQE